MKSLPYALIGTAGLLALFVGVAVLSEMASARITPGRELALGWRLAMWLALQITVFVPFMFLPLGLVTLVGAWRSQPAALAQERRLLGWWIVVGVAAPVLALGSRLHGWHVALVSVPLLLLKPASLIPPAVVWWMSRRAAS